MKIHITDDNYDYYKKINEIIQSHLIKLLPLEITKETNPIDILNTWEMQSRSIAKKVLRASLTDLISQIKYFSKDFKDSVNIDLAKHGLPRLDQLQGSVSKVISRVLKRKKINTLEEFSIVKEEVDDLESELSNEARANLDKLLYAFEQTGRKTKGG